jgi:heterodisulfide reductase subunit A
MARIGVFVCHCGENIARSVQVQRVVEQAKQLPGTVVSSDYPYMCSAPGQKLVIDAIREHGLDRVVVAACSPQLHEPTFRVAAAQAGLNPQLVEMANIREHCSWVHSDREQASRKACELLRSIPDLELVEFPTYNRELSLCCGGGSGGVWLERPRAERLSELRVRQAVEVGAEILAVACPYCLQMFEDAVRTMELSLEVRDVAELLADSL